MPYVTGSSVGYLLLVVAALGIGLSLLRRKADWIQIGLLAAALGALAWSAQTNVLVSRYYMVPVALLAIGSARACRSFSRRLRRVTVGILLVAALLPAVRAHRDVAVWATKERMAVDLVRITRDLEQTGCPVVMTGLDPERTVSLPMLVDLRRPSRGSCAGQRAYVVAGPHAKREILAACDHRSRIGTYAMAESGGEVSVNRCEALTVRLGRLPGVHIL
jgi:hypothetical protein